MNMAERPVNEQESLIFREKGCGMMTRADGFYQGLGTKKGGERKQRERKHTL